MDGNFVYNLNEDGTNRFDFWIRSGYERQPKGPGRDESIHTTREEVEANTQAISALPELLETASWALSHLNMLYPNGCNGEDAMLTALKQSLLKAGATIED